MSSAFPEPGGGAKTAAARGSSNPATPRLPPRVADHELLCRIGGGSYGEVWLARNLLGTYRAVKVVYRADFQDERPFEREFAGIKRFEPISRLHESQVDILQVGRAADYFYYVMELADDQRTAQQIDPERYIPRTLRSDIQRRATLPLSDCLDIALALTTALEHLHSHHLVHRDIKPSNIIFIGGAPKLADIGLVTGVDATRSYVGTEGFIPPEGAGSAQGDLYSLGKVLYEASTGKDRGDFPEPAASWDGTPGEQSWLEFHDVVLKACEPDPRRRYQSAQELRADLEVLRAGRSVRHLRVVERRLAVLTRFGLAVSALLMVAAVAYLFAVHEAHQARQEAQRADRAEQQALERLGDSYLDQAKARRLSGLAGRRFDSLEALRKAAEIWPALGRSRLELRNEAIACLGLADFQTAKECKAPPPDTCLVAFEPSYEYFAYATTNGELSIRRVADGTEFRNFPGAGVPANGDLKFSPDGQLLGTFYGEENLDLCVWDFRRRTVVLRTTGVRGRCLAFSADSRTLAVGQHDGPVLIYDLPSTRCIRRLECGRLPYSLAFSPDGRQLALCSTYTRNVQVLAVDSGTVLQSLPHANSVLGLAWHPAGRLLATGCSDHNIRLWDAATGTLRSTLVGHQGQVLAVAFSHQGDLLISASWDLTSRLWDAVNSRVIVTKMSAGVFGAFGPDDGWLGYGWGLRHLGLCQVSRGLECRHLYLDEKVISSADACAFSPDGQHLVSGHGDGARIWDLAAGTQVAFLPDTQVLCAGFVNAHDFLLTGGAAGLRKWPLPGPSASGTGHPDSPPLFGNQPGLTEGLCVSQDGRTIVANPRGTVYVFDAETGVPKQQLSGAGFFRLALSSDGKWVAGARLLNHSVRLWNLQDTNAVRELPIEPASCLAFSPTGARLITGSVEQYCVWDTHDWHCVVEVPRSEKGAGNTAIACAPTGGLMAVTSSAHALSLLEIETGRELASFGMPDGQLISALAFSPDGYRLAVCGQTPVIYLWDLALIRSELAKLDLDWN
jgi:WD40 repeat protein